ncbi:pyridoxamine 5'-phosphate oxidase family protein [Parasphingopyxis algicola]|uniref:pyridoxamine 5'-phosphate oxidase family protein n=1 Tax=Parasphingopyxis algicola TaxID=2026624 RepID=UPI0015A4D8BD|nr:pyridoxamine 5'-phosphate oxidase family protein [Parasphingopyxis algicola]QLC26598.1 pyridoxamine 5'-phosphate oxidase family protein [Parasphingopyxis algicola]
MKLSNEIRKFVADQRLGFLATVCADGTPNLSPKGLTFVLNEQQIVIGEIRSPGTISNLLQQPVAELNVVDHLSRKGFRFKGECLVLSEGKVFEDSVNFLRSMGAKSDINSVILMDVRTLKPLVSPAYDQGLSELDVRSQWKIHYDQLQGDGIAK